MFDKGSAACASDSEPEVNGDVMYDDAAHDRLRRQQQTDSINITGANDATDAVDEETYDDVVLPENEPTKSVKSVATIKMKSAAMDKKPALGTKLTVTSSVERTVEVKRVVVSKDDQKEAAKVGVCVLLW